MKTTASVKTIIELKGGPERVELVLLISMMPLWGILFPLFALSNQLSFVGPILLLASFFCFLHFLHLNNSHFSFEKNGIRLPGVDHRLRPYASLRRMYIYKTRWEPVLAIDYVPPKSVFKKQFVPAPLVTIGIEIQHLTEDSASQLWQLFSSNLKTCEISPDVHDELINGRPKIAELAEIKKFDLIRPVGKYLKICIKMFVNIWLIGWTVVAAIAFPVNIFDMLTGSHLGTQLLAAVWEVYMHAAELVGWLLRMTHK